MGAAPHVITTASSAAEIHRGRAVSATVGIIGGGLAGLAAACALSDAGYRVSLFERKPFLGGRASSYEHPATGEVVDNCQHVLLGCCTNLLDLYARLGVGNRIRWYDRLTFIAPGGRRGVLEPSRLPAPFHALPAFMRFPHLSALDKASIAVAMLSLMEGVPADTGESFLRWLRRTGQTQRAIDRFWSPVLVSALNEELSDVSVPYGAMVFRDAFLKSAQAGRMGIPSVALSQLYAGAADYIRERGGEVLLRAVVENVGVANERAWVSLAGEVQRFDYVISAVPFLSLSKILPPDMHWDALYENIAHLRTSPITGIHFWFDRELTELEHAVLLDRTIQWMFQKSKILDDRRLLQDAGSYLELVVSSSKSLVEKSRQEVLDLALSELAEFFPEVKNARVLKATVIKELHATFAPEPGSDRFRPKPAGPWKRLFLSGDWTATGWPATMEGAVRAGYGAAEALAAAHGQARHFLVADLPPQDLMRLFS